MGFYTLVIVCIKQIWFPKGSFCFLFRFSFLLFCRLAIKGTSGAVDGVRDHHGIKASNWTERVHSVCHMGELKWQEGLVGGRGVRPFRML